MIRWSLGLYHTSPSAYDFIKSSYFLKLPHNSILLNYSLYTTLHTGFNADTIQKLCEEDDLENLKEHEKMYHCYLTLTMNGTYLKSNF